MLSLVTTVWKEPIFDRTLEDVEIAIQKISDWKKGHSHHVDIKVDDDALVLQGIGNTSTTDTAIIVENEGAVYVEDGILLRDLADVYDLKGCLNLADLNRIEGNILYLANEIERYGYAPNIHGKVWTKFDMPNQNDMSRILDNIRDIIRAYYSPDNPPSLPTTMLSYSDINAIEENLYLIKELLDCMQKSFKSVGTIKSGATIFLPIRR